MLIAVHEADQSQAMWAQKPGTKLRVDFSARPGTFQTVLSFDPVIEFLLPLPPGEGRMACPSTNAMPM